MTMYILNFHVC